MRLFRPCFAARYLYPEAVFRIKTAEKVLCLTFDDGPDPVSTPLILKVLGEYGIKAIFFCNGRRAETYPDLADQIKSEGHVIGNHGHSHLNGWRTSTRDYMEDVTKAASFTSGRLFRPPFGRLTFRQFHELNKNFLIWFWDLMPYDFDVSFGEKQILRILKEKIRPGSVIVLHDTPYSAAAGILPEFIDHAKGKGYRFIIHFPVWDQ